MKTSKLLELAALLTQYAAEAAGTRQLMAQSLAKIVLEESKQQEHAAEKRENENHSGFRSDR